MLININKHTSWVEPYGTFGSEEAECLSRISGFDWECVHFLSLCIFYFLQSFTSSYTRWRVVIIMDVLQTSWTKPDIVALLLSTSYLHYSISYLPT